MSSTSKLMTILLTAPVLATTIALAPTALAQPTGPTESTEPTQPTEPTDSADPSDPAEPDPAQLDSMHRGQSGCFSWSWKPGPWTTTVYWHNQCSTTKTLRIAWSEEIPIARHYRVRGDGKGHAKGGGHPVAIEQE